MTEEQIKEIRARADAATQGPWSVYTETEGYYDDEDEDYNPEDYVVARGIQPANGGLGLNKGEDVERFDLCDVCGE